MRTFKKHEYELFCNIASVNQEALKGVLAKYLKKKYKKVEVTNDYIVAHGRIPIALVAHMDTVFKEPPKEFFYDTTKNVMWSPEGLGADDRAGVFAILSIIESGLRPHIIFTTDEEVGGIGAMRLADAGNPFKDLRYMIQLDRRGTSDCVFYDCDNPEFEVYVEEFGFQTAWGSFSDISELCPEWGIAGVNLSIGYQDEHSYTERLYVAPLLSTIGKVKKMLSEKDIPSFKYIPSVYSYGYSWKTGYANLYIKCAGCGKHFYEEDLFPVKMLDGSTKLYCTDCVTDPKNKITFCDVCYESFEYAHEDCIPSFCDKCEREALMKGAI